jgi:1-acyl-sn-glycerol-3-phosphate acyltransferase
MYYIGRIIGWILFLFLILPLRFIYGKKECEYLGTENLEELKGKSFFIASNHIKPRSKFLKFISFPYDAFVARKMLLKFGFYVTALTSYDSPTKPKSKIGKFFVEHVKQQLSKGIIVSIDLIPLNRKASDSVTLQNLSSRIKKHPTAIGIFPEGTWFRGFRVKRKMYNGIQVLSKRYNLPVLPIYIDAYNMNRKIQILVGKPLYQDTHLVAEKIRELYLELKQNSYIREKNYVQS